ncbi:MAG: DoxX family membrane protein ['Candidatus Kapabacteria' thiocyanatum]|nr:DoxX family membrane protein ['Candidatus Kapabacteria' thiocyanatum]
MNVPLLVMGRVFFMIPFLVFGIMHLMAGEQMAGMVPIPGGVIWIYITGIAQIAAAISILTGKQTRLACILLALLMLIYVVTMHIPGMMHAANQAASQASMSAALKDLGLAGGALILAYVHSNKA